MINKLWSKRWSTAKGWHWVLERPLEIAANEQEWLQVFQRDEPEVLFKIAKKIPK